MIATKTFRSLPSGDLTWRVETFAELSAARGAETSLSVVAEARGKVWLLTIGPKGARTPGATFVTEVGPLPIPAAPEYEMIVLDGDLPANSNVLVHTHSGPEAWYVLSGKQCLDLTGRAVRANAGEGMFAPAETPACERDLEGIVAKHRQSRYVAEDSNPAWVKIRNRRYSQMIGRDELLAKRYEAAGAPEIGWGVCDRASAAAAARLGH